MFIATAVVSVLLAVLLIASSYGKFTRGEMGLKVSRTVGWPENLLWVLGLLEVAGAVGLVIGLFWWPIGVAAAIGVVLYFAGAVIAHLRSRDPEWQPAVVIGLIAVAALVLRVLSA
ncbi:DoxX family protein [Kineosporia sp. NBRC 101731]|uniref:DoxX family protein n=1 Tax=Kineosporia sp. NBRC 101731 TaxID=3032199 RepID=UPI0024A4ACE9|nr:DoxX family protein [Kineosporia sp. NBRC 101731]GLY33236.1 hypothetical protein Kisp02_66010 [Kineosporia sp. NBRC 101731]